MRILILTFLTIYLAILTQASKFSELTGLDNNLNEVSFSKYENKCVFVTEIELNDKENEKLRVKFLNKMNQKYSRNGLKIIGFLRSESPVQIPDDFNFDVYLGPSIEKFEEFLGNQGYKLASYYNYLIKKDGERFSRFEFGFHINNSWSDYNDLLDFLLNRPKDLSQLIENNIKNCLKEY